jgi:hypothetical protein
MRGIHSGQLRGKYATRVLGQSGFLPEAGVGIDTYDGAGGGISTFKQNIPGDAFNERQNIRSNTTGTYTLDAREWAPRASLVWKRSLCLKGQCV